MLRPTLLLLLLSSCTSLQTPNTSTIRFATFNVSFYRATSGALIDDLRGGQLEAGRAHARILQYVRPDVLLLNEVDYDADGAAVESFQREYLEVAQGDLEPIHYPYRYLAPANTGVPSGHDLDNDGSTDGPGDAYGFGRHPGNYGMVVLSRYPIVEERVRTFRKFLWRDMPDARIPPGWYSDDELAVVRLSSKNHMDVPIDLGAEHGLVHFLVSHPTPPVFDGPEDRNGRRNHDEIRIWADYVSPAYGTYLRDDAGRAGALAIDDAFLIAGDLNSDPNDGDSTASIAQLLRHPRVRAEPAPRSIGGVESAWLQGGVNSAHVGPAAEDTGDFGASGPGNLRLDYVLPSKDFDIVASGVYWPALSDLGTRFPGGDAPPPPRASTRPPLRDGHELVKHTDHRLVWVDVRRRRDVSK